MVCFVWISEQTVITSLYSITSLSFITETKVGGEHLGLN